MPGQCGAPSGCLLNGGGLELQLTVDEPGLEPGEEAGPRGPRREAGLERGGTWTRARRGGGP